MTNYEIVGLMSGTSLDGLDIAHVLFEKNQDTWTFKVLHTDAKSYSDDLRKELENGPQLSKSERSKLDVKFGREMAMRVNAFIKKNNIDKTKIDAIASHGHTVLHQPQNGFSLQIGSGEVLAKETGILVINDFRNGDIAVGGQGAPLVPIGDMKLFSAQADAFLNLGGFCNISFQNESNNWVAFDIAPCNLPLNRLSAFLEKSYDAGGEIARSGEVDFSFLEKLNHLPYFQKGYPKSLGTEWLESDFYPLIDVKKRPKDNLRTIVEHIALQIAEVIKQNQLRSVFVTGGGAYNSYLLQRVEFHSEVKLIVPADEIIEYKEALIFAFLGALYLNSETSNVPSATGAREAVCLGVEYRP